MDCDTFSHLCVSCVFKLQDTLFMLSCRMAVRLDCLDFLLNEK